MQTKTFHFIAIGGVGQSALAKILLQLGYKVTGSDIQNSKYTKLVEDLGAEVFIGHKKENIKGEPTVVISSAIKEDNPELIEAKRLGLEILHRSDCLKLISEKFPIFVGLAGTHGKTTTSGLLSFILDRMGENPSFAIGGIIPKLNINANASKTSKIFVAELDESDGTIQKYHPNYFLINNLEEDHLDYYKNGLCDILATFEKTVSNMQENDKLFLNVDNMGCNIFKSQTDFKNIITYAIDNVADYMVKNIKFVELDSSFEVYKKDTLLGKINLIVPGLHNICNALAIVSILDTMGFEFSEYAKFFEEFSGMGRRFQLVSDNKKTNIKIIDDYAHHPSEIKSTLNAIQKSKRRKVVIFQPHRYTRLKGLWNEFLSAFYNIDKLYVLDVFSAGDEFDSEFNSKNFAHDIKQNNVDCEYIEGDIEQAGKTIAQKLHNNDLVLTLGAGDITKIGGVIDDLLSK